MSYLTGCVMFGDNVLSYRLYMLGDSVLYTGCIC